MCAGCVGELSLSGQEGEAQGLEATFGRSEDMMVAAALWTDMRGHERWPSFAGLDGLQVGASPHGNYVSFHLNAIATSDPQGLPYGSIVVKRNFMDMADTQPAAITVMQRLEQYDPDNGDWFYVKYDVAGSVLPNADGVPLAGAIGKGGNAGCVPCHNNAGGGDFIFKN